MDCWFNIVFAHKRYIAFCVCFVFSKLNLNFLLPWNITDGLKKLLFLAWWKIHTLNVLPLICAGTTYCCTGWLSSSLASSSSSSSSFGGGAAVIMWRCLREGVIDGWIQANCYIQDIIRWSNFMVSYDMEQNRDWRTVRCTRFITLLCTWRLLKSPSD